MACRSTGTTRSSHRSTRESQQHCALPRGRIGIPVGPWRSSSRSTWLRARIAQYCAILQGWTGQGGNSAITTGGEERGGERNTDRDRDRKKDRHRQIQRGKQETCGNTCNWSARPSTVVKTVPLPAGCTSSPRLHPAWDVNTHTHRTHTHTCTHTLTCTH